MIEGDAEPFGDHVELGRVDAELAPCELHRALEWRESMRGDGGPSARAAGAEHALIEGRVVGRDEVDAIAHRGDERPGLGEARRARDVLPRDPVEIGEVEPPRGRPNELIGAAHDASERGEVNKRAAAANRSSGSTHRASQDESSRSPAMSALATMITVSHPSSAVSPAPRVASTAAAEAHGAPALAPKWIRAFDALVARECFDPHERQPDGSWRARVYCSLSSGGKVRKSMPGDYERAAQYWQERVDKSGKPLGIELETAIWSCDAERSIFSYLDHWQAGLCGAVWVYDTEESYRRALAAAVAEAKEHASYVRVFKAPR